MKNNIFSKFNVLIVIIFIYCYHFVSFLHDYRGQHGYENNLFYQSVRANSYSAVYSTCALNSFNACPSRTFITQFDYFPKGFVKGCDVINCQWKEFPVNINS